MSLHGSQRDDDDDDDSTEVDDGKRRSYKRHKPCRENSSSNTSTSFDLQLSHEESASAGVLEWVTVKNFMCHDHLNFTFSSNINFVQGRNGSGKSAILTAVVVGLGGSSRLTNRGNNLKELVKYGKQIATIEIGIKNSGRDAFKHELFGDSIVVERKIHSNGGGGYKIKAKNGTIVSVKKDEMQRMLDHFNLQVDNPITVLNQDMSRAFLKSTDPQALYQFFLKATQLQQMKEDYNQLDKALNISLTLIRERKEILPLLKKEVDEHRAQYEFSSIFASKMKKKVQDLRKELVWALVIRAEKEEQNAREELEQHESKVAAVQEKINNFRAKYEEEKRLHSEIQEELNNMTNKVMDISQQVKASNESMIRAKKLHKDKQMHCLTAERKVANIQTEVTHLKEAVAKDNDEAQSKWLRQHTVWQEKVNEKKSEIEVLEQIRRTEESHLQNIQNTVDMKKIALDNMFQEEKALRSEYQSLEQELRSLKSNNSTVFGHWVPQLLQEIDIAYERGAFSKKPVGPLGSYIKLGNEQWGHVAEFVIGNRIKSFCVDNYNDKKVLTTIIKKMKFGREPEPTIIVSRFRDKVHDVRRFEVQSNMYPSLWSVLIPSNIVVANTLLDQMQVESILLIPTVQEAGLILKDVATVPLNCKAAFTLNLDNYTPDPNYRVYTGKGQVPTKYLQVSVEQKVRNTQAKLQEMRKNMEEFNKQMQEERVNMSNLEAEILPSRRKLMLNKKMLDQSRLQLANLMNQEEPPPPDVSQLEEDIKQQEAVLREAQINLEKIKEEVASSQNSFRESSIAFEKLKGDEKSFYEQAENLKEKLNLTEHNVNKNLQASEMYKKKEKELNKGRIEAQKKLKKASDDVEKELQNTTNFQPRINTNRSVEEVERQYNGLLARLNKESANCGDPVQIAQRYKDTKERYAKVSAEMDSHYSLIKKISESLAERQEHFKKFRKFLSIMIKSNFKASLCIRNLVGDLMFDFENQTLSLNVFKKGSGQDVDSVRSANSGNRDKKRMPQQTLAMMSGGERSFSTVSFIIALWDVIESPIRILDEFDVFMDIVSRKQSMTMMIKAAKCKTQYIFLTPLDIDTIAHPNIYIFRMPDPERNDSERRGIET
ncbi:structural maintenance of chromosomes protein 6 [Procambarus clarkii]|uniref:structural maintenance of chromosomes protein 6 n=1 Tax=Procambarus clarkii TaxID=6728 RepID=UPI001E6759AB|nr:structural maintenance of chromosomes protein 6-like [Procambarus clarkii]